VLEGYLTYRKLKMPSPNGQIDGLLAATAFVSSLPLYSSAAIRVLTIVMYPRSVSRPQLIAILSGTVTAIAYRTV
jgi:hypothetical protein